MRMSAVSRGSLLLERLALHQIKVRGYQAPPPPENKKLWTPRIVEVCTKEEYRHQLHKARQIKSACVVAFFTSEESKTCQELHRIIFEMTKKHHEVTFLKLDVNEPGVEEVMAKFEVPLVPTFYFHKAGFVVGRLVGSSPEKLEDLVVSFIHHAELRRHIRDNKF